MTKRTYVIAVFVVVIVLVLAAASIALLGKTPITGEKSASATAATSIETSTGATTTTSLSGGNLIVFCAGSLRIPLSRLAGIFYNTTSVDVHIEASGSVEVIRKVIDLGKRADVAAVADYRLIPKYMVPKHADWYIAFASNEVVLAFTKNSKYADELKKNPDKWYEILSRPDVRYGFSDPNKDPCGYRSIGAIALASIYYNDPSILEKLVLRHTNIKVEAKDNVTHIYVPASLDVHGENLVIRPKSVDLIGLLESGNIDYAFEYHSVAIQHGLEFIELPDEINLGNPKYEDFYHRVIVHILSGTEKERALSMESIVYGITIPLNVEHKDLALKFVELLLSDTGRNVFEELGQPFLDTPLGYGNIPEELRGYVKVVEG